jgi:hypothetical protein
MQQNMLLPGCLSTWGCESNSKISGREGADGRGSSNPDSSAFISGAADNEAFQELLLRWENEEQAVRLRRELRQRTAMQQVKRDVPIITVATMAMLTPMDED